ncbi:sugar transferase [Rhizobium sp. G21]|nr:sugar transferase [Rhizobium sp. G21]
MNPGTLSTTLPLRSTTAAAGAPAELDAISASRGSSWIHGALDKPFQFALKRGMDVTVSGLALLVLLPFFLMIAAAIVIENRGPVFFSQQRWGRGGKLIRIYKFRSMRTDMCDVSGVRQTTENDPRVTRIGAFLRKTNLDELPQLINIFLGDMSIVGPRCHVPKMLATGVLYEDLVRDYHIRHLVRPGLTGLAQMNGYRGPTNTEEAARGRVAYDIEYIKTFSILQDIRIIIGTAVREFRGGTGF